MNEIRAYLDRLAELRDERAKLANPFDEQIKNLEYERDVLTDGLDQHIADVENEIRIAVTKLGQTVKGSALMAVWNKGRVKWDTKGLDGYAIAHPEIEAFRSEGEPSVSIRVVKR